MDILKRLRSQADQVEVVDIQGEATQVRFEGNRLKASQVMETQGAAVRVVRDGRLGFAASSDRSAGDKLVANALESAAFGDEIPIRFPGPQPSPEVEAYDAVIADLPIPRLVEIGQEIVELALTYAPDARTDVSIDRGVQRISIRNDAGSDVSFRRSPLSIVVFVNRVRGDDMTLTYDVIGTTAWTGEHLAAVHRLGDKLKRAERGAALRSGRMPVLFAPGGVLALMLPLAEGINGKNVYQGTSPLAGKIGEKLFDEKISLADDATLPGRFASAPYDDEGVAHRRSVLVEKGVLKGFIYDLKTAAQSGVESTGNGSRTLFRQPYPEPTNVVVAGGDTPLADMIAGIDEGLLVEDVLGLGQGNIISGAFSNPLALGFKIEKGEIVGRVKDVSLAGNVYELLKEVAAVSRETVWLYSTLHLPYMLLPDMNVIAKE